MIGNEIAKVYASALLEISQEKGDTEQIQDELQFITDLFKADRELVLFLNTPGIPKNSKKNFIEKTFSESITQSVVNFICVLIEKNRQSLINDIYEAFVELNDEINNRKRVEVISSEELNSEIMSKLRSVISDKLKKEVILEKTIDKNIIGGILIKIDDVIIDGSLANSLKKMKEILFTSNIRSEMAYED